jgi:DNA polymerase-1
MGRLTALYPAFGKSISKKQEQLSLFTHATVAVEPAEKLEVGITVHVVDDAQSLDALVKRLQSSKVISFDTETTSTDQMRAELVGISLAVDPAEGWYIPVGHEPALGQQIPIRQVIDALRGPLTDASIPKIGHNPA